MTFRSVCLTLGLIAGLCFYGASSARAATGTITASPALAWSDKVGWINFNPSNGGVTVGDGGLSGYVWSQNYGWINLAPSQGGVRNDGQGTLSGEAWGEQVGWIDFSGVVIGPTGVFSGSASGQSVGSVTFSCTQCSVRTNWRPIDIVGPSTATASSLTPLSLDLSLQDASTRTVTVAARAPGATFVRLGFTLDVLFAPWAPFRPTTTLVIPSSMAGSGTITVYGQVQDALGRSSPITPFFFLLNDDSEKPASRFIKNTVDTKPTSPAVQTTVAGFANSINVACVPFLTMNLPSTVAKAVGETRKLQFFLQTFLRRGNAQVIINGRYDASTRRAVRDFQAVFANQLKGAASGVVGTAVREKINDLACQARLLELFSSGTKK